MKISGRDSLGSERPKSAATGAALVLAGAMLWSTGGVLVKWLSASGELSAFAISGLRSFLAAGLFLAVARRGVVPRFPDAISRRWFWIGAVAYAYVVTGFCVATVMTTAANAIILQDTAPLWVLLWAPAMLGERARPRDVLAVALGIGGVALCLRHGLLQPRTGGALSVQTLGDLIALSTGLAFALVTIAMRRQGQAYAADAAASAIPFLFVGNLIAVLAGFAGTLMARGTGGIIALQALANPTTLLLICWLGVGQIGMGYLLVQRGLRTVPAFQAALLALAEPVFNPVWVALAIGEIPPGETIAGGILVLSAMVAGMAGRRA